MSVQTESWKQEHMVLIVDDLASNLLFFSEAVSGFGYNVITAADGEEALEKLKGMPPDLILTDVNMPKMDGYELCEAVKADSAYADIPLVLVTAQEDRESLVRGLKLGAEDFLIKPVSVPELEARVKNLLLVKDYRDHMKSYTADLEEQVSNRTVQLNDALDEIRAVNIQLQESTMDTIQRLSTAAEYKDEDTAAHIWRMSNYATILARKIGQDEAYCDQLLYASPMHDVGKIGTPDNILRKNGPLDDDERVIMRQHTIIGERILDGSENPLLVMAKEIAGGHHEWWNGEGYPRNIAGEDIPLSARITSVADVYDALTTKRVYKEAWPVEKALEHMESLAGLHFDPSLVHAFISAKDEVLEVQQAKP